MAPSAAGCSSALRQAIRAHPTLPGQANALHAAAPGNVVSIDFIGPRVWFGRSLYILVILDHYSRMMITAQTDTPSGAFALDTLHQKWVPTFGAPFVVLSDNSPLSNTFSKLLGQSMGSKHVRSFAYYPSGNGTNESSHRLLEHAIKTQAQSGPTSFRVYTPKCYVNTQLVPAWKYGGVSA